MKLRICGWEYCNIRKIENLKIELNDEKDIHFFMMSNGTGKTTTITLLRAIFDRTAEEWGRDIVKGFAPKGKKVKEGFFSLDLIIDKRKYTIRINLDYIEMKASYQTNVMGIHGGLEDGWQLGTYFKNLFTPQFVSRFVFDGEQAKKTMSNESQEAEEAILYLYQLDKFDVITAHANHYLDRAKEKGAKGDTDQGFKKMLTACENKKRQWTSLVARKNFLETEINEIEERIEENEEKIENRLAGFTALNREKNDWQNKKIEIDQQILNAVGEVRQTLSLAPAVHDNFARIMLRLAKNMQDLKLPRSISKNFFRDLSRSDFCICGRPLGEEERRVIVEKSEDYLGEEELIALNAIRDKLISYDRESVLEKQVDKLRDLNDERDNILAQIERINEKLINSGDDEVKEIKELIDNDKRELLVKKAEYGGLINKNTQGSSIFSEKNNIKLALEQYENARKSVEKATATVKIRKSVEKLQRYCREMKTLALNRLKQSLIEKTNQKIKAIIKTDDIEIISIDKSINLDRAGGSEGQSLDIAYAFVGTLFESSTFEFPFVIDSPAGKLDFTVRKEIAACLPSFFKQLIVFVISPEVESFADAFYDNQKAEFSTIISKEELKQMGRSETSAICVKGSAFFDQFQRTIKEDH